VNPHWPRLSSLLLLEKNTQQKDNLEGTSLDVECILCASISLVSASLSYLLYLCFFVVSCLSIFQTEVIKK